MLSDLLREGRLLAREPGFGLVLGLCLVLTLGSLWYGQRRVEAQLAQATAANAAQEARLGALQARVTAAPAGALTDPGTAAGFAMGGGAQSATLPVRPLGLLAVGSSDVQPWVASVSLRHRGLLLEAQDFVAEEIANPYHLQAGHLDFAFVLAVLLPLLVIAWMYACLAGDREAGRARLLLVQEPRHTRLLLVRVGVRWATLTGTCLIALAAGLLAIQLLGGHTGIDPLGLGALAALIAGYLALWFALGWWLATWGRSAAWNAVALAACWVAATFLVPQAAVLVVDQISPAPSRTTLTSDLRDISNRINAEGDAAVTAFYRAQPTWLRDQQVPNLTVFLNRFFAVHQLTDRAIAPRIARFAEQSAARDRALTMASVLSPAALVQQAITSLAGTAPGRHQEFHAQVIAYRQQLYDQQAPLVFADAPLTADHLRAAPAFAFRDSTTSNRDAWLATLVFATLTLVLLALALRGMKRPA